MRLLKNGQMRGARRPMSDHVLWLYVEAKSAERNEADRRFSAAEKE
jgi:type IV secretory pathway VirB9-like protein